MDEEQAAYVLQRLQQLKQTATEQLSVRRVAERALVQRDANFVVKSIRATVTMFSRTVVEKASPRRRMCS